MSLEFRFLGFGPSESWAWVEFGPESWDLGQNLELGSSPSAKAKKLAMGLEAVFG